MALIRLRVHPRSAADRVVGFREDVLHLRVTAPPVDGKANRSAVSLLADALGIPRSRVRIVRGHSSRDKAAEVESLTLEEVRQRLPPGG